MQNAERSMQKFGKKLRGAGAALSVGLTAPIVALGAKGVFAFDQQAKAIAQVEAGIKSTGGAAGKTATELTKMAASLQGSTLFGDEEILKDVTAQLLTFTNIAGTQFDRTQKAVLDLATRLDGDLKSASIQLGKALNDPVANLSALSRSGIQFSTDQKKVIKSLVETGRIAEAQTVILDELEKQYGGAAEAAAKAGLGPFKQLGNALGDLTEDFGKIIVEALLPFVEKLKSVVSSLQNLDDGTKKTIAIVAGFAAALGPILFTIGYLATNVIPGLIVALKALQLAIMTNPIGALATTVTVFAGAVLLANTRLTSLTDANKEFANLSAQAGRSIAAEKVALDNLIRTANNERISKEKRLDAIKELNRVVPQYNGELTLETLNTDKAREATDKYVQSLLLKAKVQAAQEKLVEVERQLLDLMLGQSEAADPSFWQNLGNAVTSFGSQSAYMGKTLETVVDNMQEEEKQLTSLQKKLLGFLQSNQDVVDGLKGQETTLADVGAQGDQTRKSLTKLTGVMNTMFVDNEPTELYTWVDAMNQVGAAANKLIPTLTKAQQTAGAVAASINEQVGPAIQDAAATIASGFGKILAGFATGTSGLRDIANLIIGTLGDLMIRLGEIAIQAGIGIQAIKAAFESLNPAVAIAAGIALIAFGSLIKSAIQSAPPDVALAQGGLVRGETLALIGDNRNAAFDPEVVAPLSKLRDFINPNQGAGGVDVHISGKLEGNDLKLVIDRQIERKIRLK